MATPAHAKADSLFSPEAAALYKHLLKSVRTVGPYGEEVKKTCVHLTRKSAFLGVHPRKSGLLLTVKATRALEGECVVKTLQASKSRWYVDVKIGSASQIDETLLGWIRDSWELSA
jgi:pantothenate synthetase